MAFRYLRDPLFLVCLATYFVNRFILKKLGDSGFVHEHLNDLICIPFWVPIMLYSQRRLGLRSTDAIPQAGELIIPLILWSWAFEICLPGTALLGDTCVADYLDIVYYSLGTLIAAVVWRWWYSPHGLPDLVNSDGADFGIANKRA